MPTCALVTQLPYPAVPFGEAVWLAVVPVCFLVTDGAGHVSTCIGHWSSLFLMFKNPRVPRALCDLQELRVLCTRVPSGGRRWRTLPPRKSLFHFVSTPHFTWFYYKTNELRNCLFGFLPCADYEIG